MLHPSPGPPSNVFKVVVPQGTIAADAGLTPTASKTSAIDTSASFLKSVPSFSSGLAGRGHLDGGGFTNRVDRQSSGQVQGPTKPMTYPVELVSLCMICATGFTEL